MGGGRRPRRADRFSGLLTVLLLLLGVVGVRLIYLQVFAAPGYARAAEAQRLKEEEIPARRGALLDREGMPLAVTADARDVFATPYLVEDPSGVAKALAGVLGGDAAVYERKLRADSGYQYIARQVSMDRAKELEQLDLAGIGFEECSKRTYPAGELACQVIGYVGIDGEGLAGLEKHYDPLLAGEPGLLVAERDTRRRPIPGGVRISQQPVDGMDVVLTIDKDIQYEAQAAIAEAVETWDAKSGSVIVMDPRNGEILAAASVPAFDPNSFGKSEEASHRLRPITDTYEPGSTIKTFTAAAVIDKGLFKPNSKFGLPSVLKVGGRTIHEAHGRGAVTWTLTEIVTKSSNIGAVKLGQALGKKDLYRYFERFGLTRKTGVDYPGEAEGYLPPPSQWSASSIGNIPFGQGISVTPLQLARSLAVVANGGKLVTPHFLLDVPGDPDAVPEREAVQAVDASTTEQMTRVLMAVITEGTGEGAKVAGYSVAGKTGTAQKARSDGRGYAGGGYVASFSGYLPAEDPRVLIIVTVDEPRNAIYGGVVAAPVFSRVAAYSVSHLKVLPQSAEQTATSKPAAPAAGDSGR